MRIERIARENGVGCTVRRGENSTRISFSNACGWAGIVILRKDTLEMKKIKLVFAYRSLRNMCGNWNIRIPYHKDFIVEDV